MSIADRHREPASGDPTTRDPIAGDTLGRYELLAPVASGGMAKVWAARLRGTRGFQKIVAIKTMLPGLRAEPKFERMFLDEATLAARVVHPHVSQILDLGEERGVLYLVIEWIDGEPLVDILRGAAEAGGVPVPVAVRIAMQTCAGVHAAHELRDEAGEPVGLVHRDISPHNIMVTLGGVAKVVDFGIAAVARGGPAGVELRGKAAYAAPEQVFDDVVDRRTDVFALGIVLYEMTTGVHPFVGENELETMAAITSPDPPVRPSERRADYPPELERVVLRALAKERQERFPTANDMLRALDLALVGSERASTDEDVAVFVSKVRGAEHDARAELLAEAMRSAEKRLLSERAVAAQIEAATPSPSVAPRRLDSARPLGRPAALAGALALGIVIAAAAFTSFGRTAPGALARAGIAAAHRTAPALPAAAAPAPPMPTDTPAAVVAAPQEASAEPAGSSSAPRRERRAAPPGSAPFRSPVRAPGF